MPAAPSTPSRHIAVLSSTLAISVALAAFGAAPAFAAAPTQTIAAVQGAAVDGASPFVGSVQTVDGIVTADYRGTSGYRGIVVQTAGSGGATDATPGASDGIFVYLGTNATPFALGDRVTATGEVRESFGQTQLGNAASGSISNNNVILESQATVELVSAKAAVPASDVPVPVSLADTVVGSAREALESQLVAPTGSYSVASAHQLFNFGTLWLTAGPERLVKSTETTDASDPAAAQIQASNRAKRLLLDDGYNISILNSAHVGTQPYFATTPVVRSGDTVNFPAQPYVLGYGFEDWRLQPTVAITDASPADYKPTFTSVNPRPTAPPVVGGDISVADFNVLNYFTTLSSVDRNARGAATAAQFEIQRGKAIAAISGLGADIVGLQEIENSIRFGKPADTAVADLVAGLNAAAGSDVWAFVPTPVELTTAAAVATTDFITTAIIYKKAVASPVGASFAKVDETVWFNAREPIAQTFTVASKTFTVVTNHFKSKSGAGTEPTDGQGFFNTDRVNQASSLLEFTNSIIADPSKTDDVLLLGDFNAYAQEDPIQVLTGAGLVDLLPSRTDNQYTYEFNGELGSLDHAIATPSLAQYITGIGAWNINAPEWGDREYKFASTEPGTVFRSSDHNPLKIGVATKAAPVAIDIVSINDFHGRLEEGPPPVAGAARVAGAAALGGMVKAYEAANPNTLFVAAGDSIGATTFTSFIQNDEPTLDVLNAIGLDATAFGNHEFDQGSNDVNTRVIPNSNFPYLGANIYLKGTQTPAYDEYSIKQVGGVSVGFIGAITEQMPSLVSPDGIANLDFGPVVPAVNRVATQLSDGVAANGEADVLVLLVHEGAATGDIASATDASAFGQIVTGASPEVDAIISAHTHTEYNHLVPVPGTTKSRPVLQSGEYGEAFGHISMSVDPESGELLSISSERLPLFGKFAPDPIVATIVSDAVAVARVKGSVKVGDITADFNRAVSPTGSENRGGESSLGNFVADVQLWATRAASTDLTLMNPGGLRADLKFAANPTTPGDGAGVVTFAEAAAVQPFANTLVAMDLSTTQLKAVLEQQWQPAGATRPFLKLGVSKSLEYTYDPAGVAGDRIDAIYVNGALAGAGDTFRVAVNSFLASGGDNFTTLAQGTNRADTGKVDLQSMVDYFVAFPTATPDYQQRSVGVAVSPVDVDGFSAGDVVTLKLSSLLFSGSGPATGTATVKLGDTVLGSATIDPTVVATNDEVGRASVTFTVPAGVYGQRVLTVQVAENGTSIDVPVLFADRVIVPITNITAPTIAGTLSVGSTLSTTGGTWSVASPALAFQWARDGVAIAGATAATYALTTVDAGAAITVSVTASGEGYEPASATSAEVTIAKLSSTTSGSLDRFVVVGKQTVTLSISVTASGVTPTGTVRIFDGTRPIATATLQDGAVKVTLPKLSRGLHVIRAEYSGDVSVAGSTSSGQLLRVR